MDSLLKSLTGEQKRILTLPVIGSIQVKGAAGSGKTTVALLRAAHLLNSYGDLFVETRVGIFTYTKVLVKYLKSRRSEHGLSESVYISTVDGWIYRFLKDNNILGDREIVNRNQREEFLRVVVNSVALKHPDSDFILRNSTGDFFSEEIVWIKGNRISECSNYYEAVRAGRGNAVRVTRSDREYIWEIFDGYNQLLLENQKLDFDDLPNLCLDAINDLDHFEPPFSHLVVDEAQDLTKSKLSLVSKLVDSSTLSISLIADAAQRIYKSGFSWKDVGFNVSGSRTIELSKNHRNTQEIAKLAESLISNDPENNSDEYTISSASHRSGHKPLTVRTHSSAQQIDYLLHLLKRVDLKKESAVVLHPMNWGQKKIAKELASNGFHCQCLKDGKDHSIESTGLFSSTMSSIKGLEFDVVFICDVNDGLLPYCPPGSMLDDFDESRERRLLYVSITRARERLAILSVGQHSQYIDEIDSSLMHLKVLENEG